MRRRERPTRRSVAPTSRQAPVAQWLISDGIRSGADKKRGVVRAEDFSTDPIHRVDSSGPWPSTTTVGHVESGRRRFEHEVRYVAPPPAKPRVKLTVHDLGIEDLNPPSQLFVE